MRSHTGISEPQKPSYALINRNGPENSVSYAIYEAPIARRSLVLTASEALCPASDGRIGEHAWLVQWRSQERECKYPLHCPNFILVFAIEQSRGVWILKETEGIGVVPGDAARVECKARDNNSGGKTSEEAVRKWKDELIHPCRHSSGTWNRIQVKGRSP